MTGITHTDGVPADIDLDSILSDLVIEDETGVVVTASGEEPVEEVVEEISDESFAELQELEALEEILEPEHQAEPESLDADEERHLEAAIDQLEAYEAQDSETAVSPEPEAAIPELTEAETAAPEDDEIEASAEAVPAAPKTRKAKAPLKPRVASDITLLDPEHFSVWTGGVSDPEAMKAGLLSKRPKQVKIADKFDNVIGSLAAGRKPSGYVTKCFAVLDARTEVTNADLVAALQVDYTVGTSRSQAGQIMELFSILGIATRSKQALKLNPDSMFAQKLRGLIAA